MAQNLIVDRSTACKFTVCTKLNAERKKKRHFDFHVLTEKLYLSNLLIGTFKKVYKSNFTSRSPISRIFWNFENSSTRPVHICLPLKIRTSGERSFTFHGQSLLIP